jgi:hypothetical protein
MGHSSTDDPTYRKHYQSQRFVIDTGNIFRGEEQRKDKREMLSIRLLCDPNAPKTTTPDQRVEIWKADRKLQNIWNDIHEIRPELKCSGDTIDQVSLLLAEQAAIQKRDRRRNHLKKLGLKELRHSFFETRHDNTFRSLPTSEAVSTDGGVVDGEDEPKCRADWSKSCTPAAALLEPLWQLKSSSLIALPQGRVRQSRMKDSNRPVLFSKNPTKFARVGNPRLYKPSHRLHLTKSKSSWV